MPLSHRPKESQVPVATTLVNELHSLLHNDLLDDCPAVSGLLNEPNRQPFSDETHPSMSGQHLSERILDRFVRATFAIDHDQRLLYSNEAARALTRRPGVLRFMSTWTKQLS
jgi:hypothetical protein